MQICTTFKAGARLGQQQPFKAHASSSRVVRVAAMKRTDQQPEQQSTQASRREFMLNSVNVGVVAALFNWGAVARPNTLGVQAYGPDVKTLGLCPPTPNCISTAEEMNDPGHYVAPWTYNPQDGRGSKKPASQDQAMSELVEAVTNTKPDGFTPTIIKQDKDYLYVEYQSPTFGFIDDVEFFFPKGDRSLVEYRSASRIGESDGNINRKRIKALRQYLEPKGWQSTAGY